MLKPKGEEGKISRKIFDYYSQFHAHNGPGFDTWIVLNSLPCDKRFVDIIKNGKGLISLKVFIGNIQNNKYKFLNIYFSDVV